MTTLTQLITPHLGSTDAEIVALLNAATVSVVDSTRWTYAGLALRFGPAAIGQIDETLKQTPGYDWVRLLLAGTGIDFSDAVTQSALEGLRGVLGDNVDGLKAIGLRSVSPYQNAGFKGDVTVEEVAEARAVAAAETQRLTPEQRATTAWNEIVNPAVSQGQSWSAIVQSIVDDLEVNP